MQKEEGQQYRHQPEVQNFVRKPRIPEQSPRPNQLSVISCGEVEVNRLCEKGREVSEQSILAK